MTATKSPPVERELTELRAKVAQLEDRRDGWTRSKTGGWEKVLTPEEAAAELTANPPPLPQTAYQHELEAQRKMYERKREAWLSKCGVDKDNMPQFLEATLMSFSCCTDPKFWTSFVMAVCACAGKEVADDSKGDLTWVIKLWDELTEDQQAGFARLATCIPGSPHSFPETR